MTPTDTKTILIVEDDENTSSLIALYLKREGFSSATAGDGEMALALAARYRPDLVILELTLPDLDGYWVSAFIKRHKNLQETKILAISSAVSPDAQTLMEEAGIDLFMQKEKDKQRFLEKLALLYPQGSLTA